MARIQIKGDGGMTASEKKRIKALAFKSVQKKRKAGNYTNVSELMEQDIKENSSKYLIQLRKNKSKKKKPRFSDLIVGDK